MVRQINWSGYTWNVTNDVWLGNNWSDNAENVFVDSQGNLHLKITNRNGIWYSAEIVSTNPVGYGTYATVVASDPTALDRNVVSSMFYHVTYNEDEIDIEFSRWGTTMGPNVEYGIHHYVSGVDQHDYTHIDLTPTLNTTNIFNWQSNNVIDFQCKDSSGNILASWEYPGTYPLVTTGTLEFVIWLYPDGRPPTNGLTQEIVFSSFSYSPSTIVLGSIQISPTSANISTGNIQQLTATCKDKNGALVICPSMIWSSSNTSVATISSNGLVTGIATGTVNITASSGTITSNISIVTVTIKTLSSIQISPKSVSIKIGHTKQLTTLCTDKNGNIMTCPALIWRSSNISVAAVNSTGLVKGISTGVANITASSGTITSNKSITSVTHR